MVKKKQRKGKKLKKRKEKTKECVIEMSQTMSDVKTFIDKFKSDVDKKKKEYQSYAQKLQKKKL